MQSKFTRFIVSGLVALSLFGAVGVAQASSLTSVQVNAIISLLQSFGADQSVIANVSASLGGTPVSSPLSCSSFSDVSYGKFDNNPGGRVSQLQTFLGIPSSTFGFGTYGPKTRLAWSAKCGGTTLPPPHQDSTFSATPTAGTGPLTVNFNYSFDVNAAGAASSQFIVDFGDGTSGAMNVVNVAQVSHTYTSAGTYTATISFKNEYQNTPNYVVLKDRYGNILKQIITVTGGSPSGSVNFQATPTSGAAPLNVSFNYSATYSNTRYGITFGDGQYGEMGYGCEAEGSCMKGWNYSHTYTTPGTYTAKVLQNYCTGSCDFSANQVVGTATITVTGQTTNSSTATIDQDGQILSLSSTQQWITGVVPSGNYAMAQVWAIPASYTGSTDRATLWSATRGDNGSYNPNISFSGASVDATGHYSIPFLYVIGDGGGVVGSYTLLLFGVPPNDQAGPYHDSDLQIPPTLLKTAHITVSR